MSELLANRYRLGKVLGNGASAVVYAAFDEVLGIEVAIKLLHKTDNAEVVLREANLAMCLNHPSIVRCDGTGFDDGRCFIIMERVEGESLRERLEREGKLPIAEAIELLTSLASALAHAHERGVLHRDVSPSNVLILSDRRGVKLIDFGISKEQSNLQFTQTVGLGTSAYVAPEQLAGKPTAKSDLYGLAAVGVHMLTGHPPFVTGRRPTFPPSTPLWLKTLIEQCLSADPALRPESAAAIHASLARPGKSISLRQRRILSAIAICGALITASIPFLESSFWLKVEFLGRIAQSVERTTGIRFTTTAIVGPMFYTAAMDQQVERLTELVNNPNLPSSAKRQLFAEGSCLAAERGLARTFKHLLALGADLSLSCGRSTLDLISGAITSGSTEIVKILFAHREELGRGFDNLDPFELAISANNLVMFETLLRAYAEFEPVPRVRVSPPLWAAATLIEDPRYLAAAVAAGPKIGSIVDRLGNNSLHLAVTSAQGPALERLLEIGYNDLHQLNDFGQSPIHLAIALLKEDGSETDQRRRVLLKIFVEKAVDINIPNRAGDPPLHFAVTHGSRWAVETLLQSPTLELDARNSSGKSALQVAIDRNDTIGREFAQMLVSHGAKSF